MVEEDDGMIAADGALRFERLLPGPIERVWAYLTEPGRRGTWLAAGPMELRVGGRVELRFRHADLSPRPEPTPERFRRYEDGATLHGRVTRCEPPRLLAYTWGGDSEVTFELSPQGEDVLLALTHRRLRDRGEGSGVASGWHAHLGILADRLAGREPRPFWSAHAEAEARYG
jgi:uncharacterized protein YndB with AHSA1/START domain